MKALLVYWSNTGNTEKVAQSIFQGLEESRAEAVLKTSEEAGDIDWFDYDLVFVGCPSFRWAPPKPFKAYLDERYKMYEKQELVKLCSPRLKNRNAIMFCTYSGPHTGVNEAIPVTKVIGQYFDHLGFNILDEWHILGEIHRSEEMSTKGRLGNIKGLPSDHDLARIKHNTIGLVKSLQE